MDDFTFLLKKIVSSDNNKNRMGLNDFVNLVMELYQNDNQKKSKDHYEYLVRRKKLGGVKHDGRVGVAQPTTTSRYSIIVLQHWICY